MGLKGLIGKVKALILGVLKSGYPHVDCIVGIEALIFMHRFALPSYIPSDGAHALSEDEHTKILLIFYGYAWITFMVSSVGFRSIRLWYFGFPFWDFSTNHEEGKLLEDVSLRNLYISTEALMVGVFKSGRPLILAIKALTVTVKALILGVLKSGSPYLDCFVGTNAVLVMYGFALPIMFSSDGAQVLNEDEEIKRLLILYGYAWITLLVSSLGFRSIRLWYFGVAFWNFSTHHEEGTLPEKLVALKHGDSDVVEV